MNSKSHIEEKVNKVFEDKQRILNKLSMKNDTRMKEVQADLKNARSIMNQDFNKKTLLELRELKINVKENISTIENISKEVKRDIKGLTELKDMPVKVNNVTELLYKSFNEDQFFRSEFKNIDAAIRKIQKETNALETKFTT